MFLGPGKSNLQNPGPSLITPFKQTLPPAANLERLRLSVPRKKKKEPLLPLSFRMDGPGQQSSSSHRLLLSGQALLLARLNVTLCQPLAGLDKLDDVDKLLSCHDGEADPSNDPRPEAVHLVCSGELQRTRAVGVGEHLAKQRRIDLGALDGLRNCL